MRSVLRLAWLAVLISLTACGSEDAGSFNRPQCSDGVDNDGDGAIDFPDDLGCTSENGDNENEPPAAQCMDGRDNDGDGKIDFPADPGCFAKHQDDETDDCPDGPSCPQCADGKDNDMNGKIDWPSDSGGCTSASDYDEYTRNPVACGSNVRIEVLPFGGTATGMLDNMAASSLMSATCGGAGVEDVYELRVTAPKVIVATTEFAETTADTVLYIRGADCQNDASELACNNDMSTSNKKSTVIKSVTEPGTYYLVVDALSPSAAGAYKLEVKFLTGEGEVCGDIDDCGPGLVCRVPGGGTQKVCSMPVCDDGYDDDMDGKIDFPNDPGCDSPEDDDESDGCPGVGPNCPECGDGVDNDMDGKTDFGPNGDPTCTSASSASEACAVSDGVVAITGATTTGTTVGAVNDGKVSCASSSNHTAPDKTYRLDVPTMASLTVSATTSFDAAVALYDSTCGGTAIKCVDNAITSGPEVLTVTDLAAGTYYYVIDGYSTTSGTYTLNVSGYIAPGASCESPLAVSGAITCSLGYACAGTMGQRTCQPSQCLDGVDNDMDGKIDYPVDPGCVDPADNDETDPATAPVCSNGNDDDSDGMTDYPADFGCAAASGTTEAFCTGELDPATLITSSTTTGTTAGGSNDQMPTCVTTSSAPEKAHALHLPVPVQTLTVGSTGFDTVLSVKSLDCATTIACDDEGGVNFGESLITLSSVAPGGYAIVVDGWSSNNGSYTLTVKGTVAPGTPCSSPLFSGGANAVLSCPTGTTCTGTPKRCQ